MVGALAALALSLFPHAAHPCLAPQPRGPALPAPVVLHTSCGWYERDADGRTFRLPNHWGAIHGVGSGRPYGARLDVCCLRTHHIGLTLDGRVVWRSTRAHPGYGGELAFGPHEFAFADSVRGVYLTDLRSPERLVVRGRGLYPDGFTRDGDLVVVGKGALVVVARSGRAIGTHAFRPRNGYAFDRRSDTYVFVAPDGRLAVLRSRRVLLGPDVANLGALSVVADRTVSFTRRGGLTVMREDGNPVATARWNARIETMVGGEVSASPDGRTFVYALTRARGERLGATTLFVLHAGDREGHRLLSRWRSPTTCFEGGPCAGGYDWHGRFFLYQPGDGHVGIVDSATARLIDLTRLDRSLPHLGPRPERAAIAWESDFPR